MKLVYSYISKPTIPTRCDLYIMRKEGLCYNIVMAGYIPKVNKKFGVEITMFCMGVTLPHKYNINSKFSLVIFENHIYVIEVCIRECNMKPRGNYIYNHTKIYSR